MAPATLGTDVISLPPMLPVRAPDLGAAMTMVCLPPEVVVMLPSADLVIILLGTVFMMLVAILPGVAMCCKQDKFYIITTFINIYQDTFIAESGLKLQS